MQTQQLPWLAPESRALTMRFVLTLTETRGRPARALTQALTILAVRLNTWLSDPVAVGVESIPKLCSGHVNLDISRERFRALTTW